MTVLRVIEIQTICILEIQIIRAKKKLIVVILSSLKVIIQTNEQPPGIPE